MTARLLRVFDAPRHWPPLTRQTLRADFVAALTGAIVVLPQGVAFATLAGMPPEYGLYAAMVPAIVAALFGSSWHLVSGPTNAVSIVLFSAISVLAVPGTAAYVELVLCLTLLVGAMQLALGLARLGSLVNLISHTVVVAFTAGAAILIIASQIGNFFGLPIARGASFFETSAQLLQRWAQINPYVTAVGIATLVSGVLVRRLRPRFPYMIAALFVGSLLAWELNRRFGSQVTGIMTVGALPAFLPPLSLPDLSLLRQVMPAAIAVTLLGLTEAVSIGRSIAVKSGQRIDGNREFIGQGLSNIVGSFFSAYAASGSFNRSGLNYEAGARTPVAAMLSAVLLVAILYFVKPLAAYLPIASMAAVLFLVAWGLIDFRQIATIARTSRSEAVVLAVTFLATLLIQLEIAILAGVIVSLMVYLNRTTRPTVQDVKPESEPGSPHYSAESGLPDCPQLKIVRVHGSLFFGSIDHVQQAVAAAASPSQKHLLIVASSINFVDLAGAQMLAQRAEQLRAAGGGLYFYRLKAAVIDFLKRAQALDAIGTAQLFPVKQRAVAQIYPRLDSEICRRCGVRIFNECRDRLPSGEPRL